MYKNSTEYEISYKCDAHYEIRETMPATFGQRLKQLRDEHEPPITQAQFAAAFTKWMKQWLEKNNRPASNKKYNFSQQQIFKWEDGSEPGNEVVVAAASFFAVSPLYMAGITDDRALQDTAGRDITDDEWEIIIQIRSNELINAAVHQLLDLARAQRPALPEKSKKQSRITSSSETQ